jgi:hypothetical protein
MNNPRPVGIVERRKDRECRREGIFERETLNLAKHVCERSSSQELHDEDQHSPLLGDELKKVINAWDPAMTKTRGHMRLPAHARKESIVAEALKLDDLQRHIRACCEVFPFPHDPRCAHAQGAHEPIPVHDHRIGIESRQPLRTPYVRCGDRLWRPACG